MVETLEYSDQGENVRDQFFEVDKIVYVEGDDDAMFWSVVFDVFYDGSVFFEPVGGKEELKKYCLRIENGQIDQFAAGDSDFDEITGQYSVHPYIFRTFGHSIENTMYCECVVESIIRIASRQLSRAAIGFRAWYESVCDGLKRLIFLDIANEVFNLGVAVLPATCTRFIDERCTLRTDQIEAYRLSLPLDDEIAARAEILAPDDVADLVKYVRGHFAQSLALKFINNSIGSNAFTNGGLFTAAIQGFHLSLRGATHPHRDHYASYFVGI